MEILRIIRQNESLMRSFSPAQCGHVFLPVHLASKTGGVRLTTFSIAKSRKPIKNCSTGPSLLFFGRKIKVALVGIPALLGMPIFLWRRYAPVFEVEPKGVTFIRTSPTIIEDYCLGVSMVSTLPCRYAVNAALKAMPTFCLEA